MQEDRKYRLGRTAMLLLVALVFIFSRPLNSPWHPFIAGDGLGYYAYLPAKYIYQDKDFRFEWFNEAHNNNYIYSTFENPEDNLLVKYGDRKINKYYQGLSYIWLPFFWLAHSIAGPMGFSADGFSAPYQLSVGLASLVYLLMGLYFLSKLLYRLHRQWLPALCIPAAVFSGTWLFTYSIYANSLSHAYSFSFLSGFVYYLVSFFREEENRTRNFLLCALFLVIAVSIRPLTGLVVLTVPAFIPPGFFSRKFSRPAFRWQHLLIVVIALGALYHTLSISYRQTGSFLAYTYTGETFNFREAKFFDALISYHAGLFVYVPLMLLSLAGVSFLSRTARFVLPLFFFFIIFLYSAWWYWPIVKRALVDFYVIPVLFLGAYYAGAGRKPKLFMSLLLILSVLYFQLKNYQLQKGILDENATYAEIFWRNFFRIQKANVYPVPPQTILHQVSQTENFEGDFAGKITQDKSYDGGRALLLDSASYICRIMSLPLPVIFDSAGFHKIRFSFHSYFDSGAKSMHVFMQFFSHHDSLLREVPFYLNAEDLPHGSWDYREFGYEIVEEEALNRRSVARVVFTLWNVEARGRIYIDDAKVDFMVTDRSFETIR